MLRSPIIKADQKNSILSAVLKNNVGVLTNTFIVLLVKKGRESDLHEIAKTFIEQYNQTIIYTQPIRPMDSKMRRSTNHGKGFGQYGQK